MANVHLRPAGGVSALLNRLLARALSLPAPQNRDVAVERGVRIPMGDGVELRSDVYTPAGSGPHPTVLVRTPYGRGGPVGLLLGRSFAERGYRVVMQSCRGTFGSGGTFAPHFDERADGLATIRWIESQEWFDGRLAMNGPSYMGAVQWAVADSVGPSLRALCSHVTYSNIAQHWYRGGSLSLEDAIGWTTMVAEQEHGRLAMVKSLLETRQRKIDKVIDRLPVADLDDRVLGRRVPAWREIVDHAALDDPHWAPADHSPRVAAVTAQVLQVGGWYDIFLPQQLSDYRTLVAAGHPPRLVIGPWTHTSPQGFSVQVTESLRWLDRHCRHSGEATRAAAPEVRLFVMGADEWRDAASWPPPGYRSQRWHLHAGGGLAPADPPGGEPDRYTYDPAYPTPNVGGTLLRRSGGRRNQAHTEKRPDVVVFTSDVLAADLDVVGEISAEIHVSSDVEHFDVFVRLCDVDDKGRSYNVCDGMERVSPTRHPRPERGIWQVRVALWPTAQRFRSGHRIRVQVSSGAHSRFIRNLGTGEPLATATTMAVAHQVIHHDPLHPSAVILSVPGNVETSRSTPTG